MVTGREMRLPIDLKVPWPAGYAQISIDHAVQLCRTINDIHLLERELLRVAQSRQKKLYDSKAHEKPLQQGEKIGVNSLKQIQGIASKQVHGWTGHFILIKTLSSTTCSFARPGENPEIDSHVVN
ncbi:hypothetical protein D915_009182 [Fasciola hepatica]|uniref:Uncharacterized protein n=1 Tax=Fasciola hepatica TaxID=6192 RepID=A0A4E0QV25_FASHE|nr:hypothetical protein D915_009182 [Fasciola hepatica]